MTTALWASRYACSEIGRTMSQSRFVPSWLMYTRSGRLVEDMTRSIAVVVEVADGGVPEVVRAADDRVRAKSLQGKTPVCENSSLGPPVLQR